MKGRVGRNCRGAVVAGESKGFAGGGHHEDRAVADFGESEQN